MLKRQGFTLIEIMVVLVIIAVIIAFTFPSFTTPMEQANAVSAQSNLLAIYSAQQNYRNNHGSFDTNIAPNGDDGIPEINTALSMSIQDDANPSSVPPALGTYLYSCSIISSHPSCVATRNDAAQDFSITVQLDAPIALKAGGNPSCNPSTSPWCPHN